MTAYIAAIQMVSGADPGANLNQARELLSEAAAQGVKLAVLPENFALFDSHRMAEFAASAEARNLLAELSVVARQLDLWILAGSFPVPAGDGRVYARSLLFSAAGEVVAEYDKRHLFDVDVADQTGAYRESAYIRPGDALCVAATPYGRLGLSICYDLRFPVHFQKLCSQGAELISVPSAFTAVTGEAHWEILLRARAIETQSYLLGANQGGQHGPGRFTYGHSMIVSPWGEVLAEVRESGPGLAVARCEPEFLNQVRARMPLQSQRRDPLDP